jgi:hypothetical protein
MRPDDTEQLELPFAQRSEDDLNSEPLGLVVHLAEHRARVALEKKLKLDAVIMDRASHLLEL